MLAWLLERNTWQEKKEEKKREQNPGRTFQLDRTTWSDCRSTDRNPFYNEDQHPISSDHYAHSNLPVCVSTRCVQKWDDCFNAISTAPPCVRLSDCQFHFLFSSSRANLHDAMIICTVCVLRWKMRCILQWILRWILRLTVCAICCTICTRSVHDLYSRWSEKCVYK